MLLATGIKVLETLIGTATKLGTSALVKKAGKTIWDRFKNERESAENKELLRITRIAYLRASLATCRQLLKHGYKGESIKSNARQTLNDLDTYLSGQIKEARSGEWFRSSQLKEAFEVLINSSGEEQTELLKTSLQDLLLGEIGLANILPINAYKETLTNGWHDAGKPMDWLELMASSLQEELAKNEVAKATFQLKFRNELNQKLSGFDTHWQQLEDYLIRFSEYHQAFWQKLEDLLDGQADLSQKIDKTKEDFEEIKKGQKELITGQRDIKEQLSEKLVKPKHIGTRPPISEPFMGRRDELEEIHNQLFRNEGSSTLLITGPAGLGKTSLAAMYYREFQNHYSYLIWLDTQSGIRNGLLSLYHVLKPEYNDSPDYGEKLYRIKHLLGNLTKPSLLILDKVKRYNDLEVNNQLLRSLPNIHIIITSRVREIRMTKRLELKFLETKYLKKILDSLISENSFSEKDVIELGHSISYMTLLFSLLCYQLRFYLSTQNNYQLSQLTSAIKESDILRFQWTSLLRADYKGNSLSAKEIVRSIHDLKDLKKNQLLILRLITLLKLESISFETIKLLLNNPRDLKENIFFLDINRLVTFDTDSQLIKTNQLERILIQAGMDQLKRKFKTSLEIKLVNGFSKQLEINSKAEARHRKLAIVAHYIELVINDCLVKAELVNELMISLNTTYLQVGHGLDTSKSNYAEVCRTYLENLIKQTKSKS